MHIIIEIVGSDYIDYIENTKYLTIKKILIHSTVFFSSLAVSSRQLKKHLAENIICRHNIAAITY